MQFKIYLFDGTALLKIYFLLKLYLYCLFSNAKKKTVFPCVYFRLLDGIKIKTTYWGTSFL